jgi:hypothetical protein
LSEIDTLIDIGVGPKGTEDLYRVFKNANLILIDPIKDFKLKEGRSVARCPIKKPQNFHSRVLEI